MSSQVAVPPPPSTGAGARTRDEGRRWVLRPGTVVVRRGRGELQVGEAGDALVVREDEVAVRLLGDLAGAGARRRPGDRGGPEALLWRRLLERGLLVPAADLDRDLAASRRPGVAAAAWAVHGAAASGRLAGRRACRVGVAGRRDWAEQVAGLVDAGGGTPRVAARPDQEADVWLLADLPTAVDALVRADLPHLLVGPAHGAGIRVGPFVEPGRSACTGCLTATRSDRDPAAGVVDLQLSRRVTALGGEPRVAWPEDPTVVALALAWAVRDLLTWAEGDRPTTRSATVEVHPAASPVRTAWPVHPRCGCTWGAPAAGAVPLGR